MWEQNVKSGNKTIKTEGDIHISTMKDNMTEEYYDVISDAWKLMHKHIDGSDTDEYWKEIIFETKEISKKHGETPFVRSMMNDIVSELHRIRTGKE